MARLEALRTCLATLMAALEAQAQRRVDAQRTQIGGLRRSSGLPHLGLHEARFQINKILADMNSILGLHLPIPPPRRTRTWSGEKSGLEYPIIDSLLISHARPLGAVPRSLCDVQQFGLYMRVWSLTDTGPTMIYSHITHHTRARARTHTHTPHTHVHTPGRLHHYPSVRKQCRITILAFWRLCWSFLTMNELEAQQGTVGLILMTASKMKTNIIFFFCFRYFWSLWLTK